MKGNLIIISSPSGGGKGTLIKEILRTVPDIGYSVSLTTRPQRPGEVDGEHYNFVSREQFEAFRSDGGFLEWAEVHDNYYGTSAALTERMTAEGKDVILEIDVQGAAWVLTRAPDAVSIFIMPPSFEALTHRLTARATETPEQLSLRLRNSFDEVMGYTNFEYVVVNDDIPIAARRLESIILAERQKRIRQTEAIKDILNSFDTSKHQVSGE
jgi:guanylate kinase